MAELLTDIPSMAFPHEVDVLAFSSSQDFRVRLTLEDEELLDVTLTPDASGAAALYGLASLINDSIEGSMPVLTISIDGQQAAETPVLPCRERLSGTAQDLQGKIFLTLSSGHTKRIPMDGNETLAWTVDGITPEVSIFATWVGDDIPSIYTSEQTISGTDDGDIATADVSPRLLKAPQDGCTLVRYIASVGRRRQTYEIHRTGTDLCPVTGLRFRNIFNQDDTFYFFGKMEQEVKPTYSSLSVQGHTRNYRIETQPTWKAYTGPMNDAERFLFCDLAQALQVWRMDNGTQLTLTECDYKPSNMLTESPSGSLTWREAAEGCTFKPATPVRTFDKTFDKTFD